ncbi:hypothetical protein CXB51_010562 [Gossypium anomalum]|uniref:PGG domain-containing protein n=1 Tax=Gossypium anomalum TaxID=47600 RepID=A0A8J5ZDC8_9ROSI|nr:hypothetical protein CXB51_010562 [Gossypium anomalum]
MDERLKRAAETGNVDALYSFIHHDANVFKRIGKMEFVDTPLHVAAVAGNTGFAMEMMNLKPSFARKLNQDGFSPIHLALLNQQTQMVIDILSVDKDLIRVKGKGGSLFFIMLLWMKITFIFCPGFWMFVPIDKDGNTVLHLAASVNHPQMIKLLIERKEVDGNKTNESGFTAMDVLQRQTLGDNTESVNILNSNPLKFQKLSKFKILKDAVEEMTPETMGVLLIVFSLVLAMTYQGVLSPPGGVSEGTTHREGKSICSVYDVSSARIPRK